MKEIILFILTLLFSIFSSLLFALKYTEEDWLYFMLGLACLIMACITCVIGCKFQMNSRPRRRRRDELNPEGVQKRVKKNKRNKKSAKQVNNIADDSTPVFGSVEDLCKDMK